jgi:FlaA1/EpsC-like NDP-sugar epimerase
MEANPTEAIKNNVLATKTLGELAGKSGVKDFVLISTDKAVNPTSVMGASKRIAEIVLQDLNRFIRPIMSPFGSETSWVQPVRSCRSFANKS